MVYQVEEVAKLLNLKPTTIRTWLREGNLSGIRKGKRWVIDADALRKVFTSCSFHFPDECSEIEGKNSNFRPKHTEEMFRELYPEEYKQLELSRKSSDPMVIYHNQCEADLERRFPYIPEKNNDNDPFDHYCFYKKKYEEELMKLNKLTSKLREKHGVPEEDLAEVKRTHENLALLKVGIALNDVSHL